MNRHSIRSLAGVLLAGAALVGSLLAASGAQAATPTDYHALSSGYRIAGPAYHHWGYAAEGQVVSPGPLNVRTGPGYDHWIVGTIDNGSTVWVRCKAEGSDVGGNDHWYRLTGGRGWVSAYYVDNDDYVPWCAG